MGYNEIKDDGACALAQVGSACWQMCFAEIVVEYRCLPSVDLIWSAGTPYLLLDVCAAVSHALLICCSSAATK